MKKYNKLIVYSAVLLFLIIAITLVMIFDIDFILFKNLSIAGIEEKKMAVETLIQKQTTEELNNSNAKSALQISKNSFDVAKGKYENIDESTISIVKEATKEEDYFIEYLWIVLGNYATANDVAIGIYTPGATVENTTSNGEAGENNTNGAETNNAQTNTNTTSTVVTDGVKIVVEGRYANIADFVFDVENDKSLRFKLDNIMMTYSGNNEIKAVFDVLSLSVLK